MAQQTINNSEAGSSVRSKLNAMFTELYDRKWINAGLVGDTIEAITYPTALPLGTTFDIIIQCLSSGSPVQFTISDITITGFNFIAADTAELLYQINIR